jgi:ligand-binding sensor domain-containing protein
MISDTNKFKNRMNKIFLIFIGGLFLLTSCKKDVTKSDKKEILTFSLNEQIDTAKIDNSEKQISILVVPSANMKKLCPQITISEKATIKPASGDTVDFSALPVTYSVTAEDNSVQEWKVYVYKSVSNFRRDLNNFSISSVAIDISNNIWVGTDSGLFKKIDTGYILNEELMPQKILSLYFEQSINTLWVGGENGLIQATINGSELIPTSIALSKLSNPAIQSVYIDSLSKRWFGTRLGITLNKNDIWKNYNFGISALNKLMPLNFEKVGINSISGWDGDYYFATNESGLYRTYDYVDSLDAFSGATQWSSPYNGDALSDTMFVVFVDSKGNQWMGGTNGLQVHTGHDAKVNSFSFFDELPDLHVHAIAEAPDGNIWIGTENGLAVFDGTNWLVKSTTLTNPFITAIAFDKNGKTFIGTKKGLNIIK